MVGGKLKIMKRTTLLQSEYAERQISILLILDIQFKVIVSAHVNSLNSKFWNSNRRKNAKSILGVGFDPK